MGRSILDAKLNTEKVLDFFILYLDRLHDLHEKERKAFESFAFSLFYTPVIEGPITTRNNTEVKDAKI